MNLILARRLTRLAALILDYMILLVPIGIVTGVLIALDPEQAAVEEWVLQFAGIGLGAMVPLLLINLYLLGKHGQTMGKKALGIKIVRTDGHQASLLRIVFLRFFLNRIFAGIPYVGGLYVLLDSLFIFGDERRCIHDHLADTMVVVA